MLFFCFQALHHQEIQRFSTEMLDGVFILLFGERRAGEGMEGAESWGQ